MKAQIENIQDMFTKKLNANEDLDSRITEAEEQTNDLEHRVVESLPQNNNNKKKKRIKRNEDSLRDVWDNIKHTNIHIIWASEEGKKRETGPEKISEGIIVENFSHMGKEIVTQAQEVQRVPYRINTMKNTLRHINQTDKN